MVYHGPSQACETCKRRRKKVSPIFDDACFQLLISPVSSVMSLALYVSPPPSHDAEPSLYPPIPTDRISYCPISPVIRGEFVDCDRLIKRVQTCLRCRQAHRACGGHTVHTNSKFRNYSGREGNPRSFQSMARKCSLPAARVGSEDVLPKEVSSAQSNEYAVRSFFYDYCIISENRQLSRDFLDGLEPLLHRLGMESDFAEACKAVTFASHGRVLFRPSVVRQAQFLHHSVLCR